MTDEKQAGIDEIRRTEERLGDIAITPQAST